MKIGSNARIAGGAAKGLLWLLLIGVVAGGAYFVLEKQKTRPAEPTLAVATPEPATPTPTPVPATPAPVVIKATPTPLPVAVATPTPPPTPAPLDVATVVRTPSLWPPQVALVQAYPFPVVLNGRVVGDAKAPVGTVLRVLRVGGQQVEVEFQSARHVLPLTATDLMARATTTFRKNGSILPTPPPTTTVMATPPPATPPQMVNPLQGPVKIGERLIAEVVRNKKSRIEGGDWDDKRERIEMKVKVTNGDPKMTADKLQGEIYVFAESILDRTAVKLLNAQNFDFSLAPRATHEFTTDEVVTMYDTTGARFGHKYEGWVLRLRDGAGNLVLMKASSPSLQRLVEKASGLSKDKTYDRSNYSEKSEVRAMR